MEVLNNSLNNPKAPPNMNNPSPKQVWTQFFNIQLFQATPIFNIQLFSATATTSHAYPHRTQEKTRRKAGILT